MATNGDRRIGIISTRLAGTDGVSLETAKWAAVLERIGYDCFYFSGECDRPPEGSRVVPGGVLPPPGHRCDQPGGVLRHLGATAAADAEHPEIRRPRTTSRRTSGRRHHATGAGTADYFKEQLYNFIQFDLDLLIMENALTIPINLPLGLAIAEFIAETGIPVIAHHHDFSWERQRFSQQRGRLPGGGLPARPALHPARGHQLGSGQAARDRGSALPPMSSPTSWISITRPGRGRIRPAARA